MGAGPARRQGERSSRAIIIGDQPVAGENRAPVSDDRMKLLNGDRAIVELVKLRDYSLSETHPRGRHKARVFRAALGLTVEEDFPRLTSCYVLKEQ